MEQTGVPAAVRALPQRLPEYGRVLARAESGSCCAVYGLSPVHRAQLAAALRESLPERSFCAVFRDEQAARLFAADYQTLTGEEAAVLPARDMVFHSTEPVFGCIGRHLTHSYSKEIHALLAPYSYELYPMEPEEVEKFVTLPSLGGINVTIPYKRDVMKFLDVHEPTVSNPKISITT